MTQLAFDEELLVKRISGSYLRQVISKQNNRTRRVCTSSSIRLAGAAVSSAAAAFQVANADQDEEDSPTCLVGRLRSSSTSCKQDEEEEETRVAEQDAIEERRSEQALKMEAGGASQQQISCSAEKRLSCGGQLNGDDEDQFEDGAGRPAEATSSPVPTFSRTIKSPTFEGGSSNTQIGDETTRSCGLASKR